MTAKSKPEFAEEAEVRTSPQPWRPAEDLLTDKIIGAAIEVHRQLGPGLLESAYEISLCYELSQMGLRFERQVHLPVNYKGVKLDCGYRLDLVVEGLVIVELKTVEALLPIHSAQMLTYLRLADKRVGLLLNFNEPVLKKGLKRLVNRFSAASASEPREDCRSTPDPNTKQTRRLGASALNPEVL